MKYLALLLVSMIAADVALAQPASDQDSVLEEVIVTAQFRRQNLQETPLRRQRGRRREHPAAQHRAASRHREVRAQCEFREWRFGLWQDGPGLHPRRRPGDYQYVVEPGVGIYIDEVYHSTQFGTEFDLLDLERVEVLRGPQGTLFGKNSIGGAVRSHFTAAAR